VLRLFRTQWRGQDHHDQVPVESAPTHLGNRACVWTEPASPGSGGQITLVLCAGCGRVLPVDDGEPDLEVVDWVNSAPEPEHGKFSALYQWHQDDPPDEFEMNRNEVIYSYQHNRNPFIDHPEYLILIYDPSNAVNDTYYNNLSIYPNPAKDFITIKFPSFSFSTSSVSICNNFGQVVYSGIYPRGFEEETMDVSGLNVGIYFLIVKTEDRVLTSKFQIIR